MNALCKHYYDKGIPDEPWYISPGHEGQSIEREIPSIDKNGVITKRKVRITEISVGAGEYTTVNTIMKSIEEHTRYLE